MKINSTLSVLAVVLACSVGVSGCNSTTNTTSNISAPVNSFTMPSYETVTLENGLTLKLMAKPEVPIITFNAVIKAGAVNDTTAGIANMTAQGLMLGAGEQSKAEIEQTLDFIGASLATSAGTDGSYVSSNFMAKDLDTVLPIFSQVIRQPDFDATEFAKLKQRTMVGLSQQKESPRRVIGRYFNTLVFDSHPYGNAASGFKESIEHMSVSQLRQFHQSFYQPSNMQISIVGDFDVAQMKRKMQQAFGDWENGETIVQADLSQQLPVLNNSRVLLVDKPDAIETTFLIGGMGVSQDNPDLVGLTVVNTILGGRFTSWLNDELRVNAGLTYGARSAFVTYADAGVFRISTFTKSATTKEAIDLALKTYARLWQQGIDQATLDSAKAYVKGQFPPKFETSGQLAGLMSDQFLYGFGDEYINDFQARVDGLTLEKTQSLVQQYFPKQNLQFVLIGNADDIEDIAKQYGDVTKVDITQSGFGGSL